MAAPVRSADEDAHNRYTIRQKNLNVDMSAHVGIRGLLTLWIVCFHSLHYSDLSFIDIQGSAWMTMFFLLSGFSLGVIYLEMCAGGGCCPGCCCWGSCAWRSFYQNRLARILPTFYLCNCIAVPLVWLGWGEILYQDLVASIIMTVFPVYTWTGFFPGAAFDGPGWTISTLLFFYFTFPWCGRFVLWTRAATTRWLIICFVVQFVLAVALWAWTQSFPVATMIPYTRLGVFLMGIYAASDCRRLGGAHEEGFATEFAQRWLSRCCIRRRGAGSLDEQMLLDDENVDPAEAEVARQHAEQRLWGRNTDCLSCVLALLFLYCTLQDSLLAKLKIDNPGFGALYLQCIGAWPMCSLLVSLTRDGGTSRTAAALKSKLWTWLGHNGMAIYLVHQILIGYVACFYRCIICGQTLDTIITFNTTDAADPKGPDLVVSQPNHNLTLSQQTDAGNSAPAWAVLVVVPISCALGYCITRFVDAPCNRLLRSSTKQ